MTKNTVKSIKPTDYQRTIANVSIGGVSVDRYDTDNDDYVAFKLMIDGDHINTAIVGLDEYRALQDEYDQYNQTGLLVDIIKTYFPQVNL